MRDSQDIIIEQLQYIQVFEGDHRRFEVRAASPILKRSEERIRALKPYASYMLPPGSGGPLTSVSPSEAPTSLAFVRTEHNEGILVQKAYDALLRPSHVDIHMLVGLPTDFSPKEAITLYNSLFWRKSEAQPTREVDLLNSLSLNSLRRNYISPFLGPSLRLILLRSDREQAKTYLPFVIQFYLLQQAIVEHPEMLQRVPRILIIAPAAQVAYLISALSSLLPRQLLRNMTFNTYEHDVSDQQYNICGTCLLPRQGRDMRLLDLTSYRTDFVLNTYVQDTPPYIPPGFHPDLSNEMFNYANFAAKAFKPDYIDPKLREFLKDMESFSQLTIDAFLEGYHETFGGSRPTMHSGSQLQQGHLLEEEVCVTGNTKKSTKSIEKWLRDRDDSDRQQIIEMILADTAWLQNSRPQYWALLQEAIGKQHQMTPSIRDVLIRDVSARTIMAVRAGDENSFLVGLIVLSDISPSTSGSPFWHDLLTKLAGEEQYHGFIKRYWSARERLLAIARLVPELDRSLVAPLLDVEPSGFGKLLGLLLPHGSASGETDRLRFPAEWSYLVAQQFIGTPSAQLTLNAIPYFKQHHEIAGMLFKELSDQNEWPVLAQFLDKLVNSGYPRDLLFHCFEARLSLQGAEFLAARLDEKEQEKLFRQYEALCIEFFPSSALFRAITKRYLPTFPLTWDRINSLIFMLGKLEEAEINTLTADIAAMLDACIDSPIRLGVLFSPLVPREAGASCLLAAMAQHVKDEFMRITTSEEHGEVTQLDVSRVESRFSAYVQFALCVDATYDSSRAGVKFGAHLLYHLLHDAGESIFVFINGEAQYWPAELRREWERVVEKYRSPP